MKQFFERDGDSDSNSNSSEQSDASSLVHAIVHNRRVMITLALRHFSRCVSERCAQKAQTQKELCVAETHAQHAALKRGFKIFLLMLYKEQKEKAIEWRAQHLKVLMFGAWVRFSITARVEREDDAKALEYFNINSQVRVMSKFNAHVIRRQSGESKYRLSQYYYKLVCFKKSLIKFKRFGRHSSESRMRPSLNERSHIILSYLLQKSRGKIIKSFAGLRRKVQHKKNISSRLSKVRTLLFRFNSFVFKINMTC